MSRFQQHVECGSKRMYASLETARSAAKLLQRDKGGYYRPYECPHCSTPTLPSWHVGSYDPLAEQRLYRDPEYAGYVKR